MSHELAPLFEMKVLESKLVTKFVNNRFRCSSCWEPLVMDKLCISSDYFFKDLEFL